MPEIYPKLMKVNVLGHLNYLQLKLNTILQTLSCHPDEGGI